MARLLADIKTEIGNAYIADDQVQVRYGFTPDQVAAGFDANFSKVSVESLLFYAVAFTVWTFERVLDLFRVEIEAKIAGAVVANKEWWHAQALKFQHGVNLTMNPVTYTWGYDTVDIAQQIVKQVAVRESIVDATGASKIKLLVIGELNGGGQPLDEFHLYLFDKYVQKIKPAGVVVECSSSAADACDISLKVYYNPLVLTSAGTLINNPEIEPVRVAKKNFINMLNETNFGGKLYLTKLTDAIQKAEGVVDVEIVNFNYKGISYTSGMFESDSGWFVMDTQDIDYTPLVE